MMQRQLASISTAIIIFCENGMVYVQADRFHKTGRQLRSKMWWQNMKMKLIIAAIMVVLILVLVAIVCLSGTNRCKAG